MCARKQNECFAEKPSRTSSRLNRGTFDRTKMRNKNGVPFASERHRTADVTQPPKLRLDVGRKKRKITGNRCGPQSRIGRRRGFRAVRDRTAGSHGSNKWCTDPQRCSPRAIEPHEFNWIPGRTLARARAHPLNSLHTRVRPSAVRSPIPSPARPMCSLAAAHGRRTANDSIIINSNNNNNNNSRTIVYDR